MSEPQFELRLEGLGLTPETLDVSDLATLLPELKKAMCAAAGVDQEGGARLSLAAILPGSAQMRFQGDYAVTRGVEAIIGRLSESNPEALPIPCRESLHKISNLVANKRWTLTLNDPDGRRAVEISAARPIARPEPRQIRTPTTLYGKVHRVGGKKDPTVWLTPVGSSEHVIVCLSRELAKDLGRRLFEVVGLEGTAVYQLGDLRLLEFTATALTPYEQTDPVAAIEELMKVAGDAWVGVDVDEYVRGLREEGDEE